MKKRKSNIEDKLKELENDVHNTVIRNEKYEHTLDNNKGIDIMIPGVVYTHQSKSTAMDILKRYSFVTRGSSTKLARVGKEEFIKKCAKCNEGTITNKLSKFLNKSKSKTYTKKELLADVECYFDDLKEDIIKQIDNIILVAINTIEKNID